MPFRVGPSPDLDRRRFGIGLLVTIAVTMLLAVAANLIGLSGTGLQIAYLVIGVAGILVLFGYISKTHTRR
jgi:hypothetical protein